VPPNLSVSALVDRFFMQSAERCFPVVNGETFLGLVCMADLRKIPRDEWEGTPVRAIMTPDDRLATASPSENADEALRRLAARDVDQLPVIEQGRLLGMLRRADVLRWIELHAAR